MKHVITEQMMEDYRQSLIDEEKSTATVQKYLHDLDEEDRKNPMSPK